MSVKRSLVSSLVGAVLLAGSVAAEAATPPGAPDPLAVPNLERDCGRTGIAGVDAFLWLNRPGLSGAGACNGGLNIGRWWPERGLMFAKYASNRLGPAKGSRFGFRRRISLCRLGAPLKSGRYSTTPPEKRCKR